MGGYHSALAAAGGFLGGLILWFGFLTRFRKSAVPLRRLLAATVITGLVCRLLFVALTPAFYAPDEKAHFMYIEYLAENKAFPVQTSRTGAPSNDWEYYQPPLYYLALTPCYLVLTRTIGDETMVLRLLRLFSVALWGATVLLAFVFMRSMNIQDGLVQTTVVALLSLLPTFTFLSAVLNNDNLLIALGSGVLCLVARPNMSLRDSVMAGSLLGLALLTKLTAAVYVAFIGFHVLYGLATRTIDRTALSRRLLTIVIALLMWMPWAWRTRSVYGSITAEDVGNVRYPWDSLSAGVLDTLGYLQSSFWAVSGIYNNIAGFYPVVGMLVFIAACLGFLRGLAFERERLNHHVHGKLEIVVVSVLSISMNFLLAFRFGYLYGQGQGRFLFPLLLPLSFLLGLGLRMLPMSEARNAPVHLAGIFMSYALSFASFSVAMFPNQ